MELTTFDDVGAARDRMNAFIKGKRDALDALGARRKKAEAKVAALEKKRSEVAKANDDCDALDADLIELQQLRTKELGLAHIEGRKPALAPIDRAIKAKTEKRAEALEQIEATRAATVIIDTQLADARTFLASEVRAVNSALNEGYSAIATVKRDYADLLARYHAIVSMELQVSQIVSRHFTPPDNMRYYWSTPSQGVSDTREWGKELTRRYQTEVARLAVLGLPKNNEVVRSQPYHVGAEHMPTRDISGGPGIYDKRGAQIG